MLFGDIYLIPGPYYYYTVPVKYNLFRVHIVNLDLNFVFPLTLNYSVRPPNSVAGYAPGYLPGLPPGIQPGHMPGMPAMPGVGYPRNVVPGMPGYEHLMRGAIGQPGAGHHAMPGVLPQTQPTKP